MAGGLLEDPVYRQFVHIDAVEQRIDVDPVAEGRGERGLELMAETIEKSLLDGIGGVRGGAGLEPPKLLLHAFQVWLAGSYAITPMMRNSHSP